MSRVGSFTILLILACAVAAASSASAAVRGRSIDGSGARDYWSPERLRNARPMPLALVDVRPARPGEGSEHVPVDAGSAGLHYTSSRLIPEDARFFYPYSTVGRLFFRQGGDNFVCSGTVVSARLVLTAGHCVFGDGDFFTNFLFIPAYHEGDDPFGAWEATWVGTTDEWSDDELVPNTADFGVLVVDDQNLALGGSGPKAIVKIGDVTGWLGWIRNKLDPNLVHSVGFPVNLDRGERMHQTVSSDSILVPTGGGDPTYCYGSDMRGGASGGPMIQNFGVKAKGQKGGRNRAPNRVVGTGSYTSADSKLRVLCGSPVTDSANDLLNEACAIDAGNCSRRGKPKAP